MQTLKFIALACVLAIITGCAKYVTIISETDVTYDVWPSKKIAVAYNESGTIEERNFWFLIVDEMKKAGFNVVESADFDYLLDYSIKSYSYEYQDTLALPDIETTYSYDAYGNLQTQETYSTEYVPYTKFVNRHMVVMSLFPSDDPRKVVWTGAVSADHYDFKAYPRECVATLLQFFGGQHEGETKLVKRK